jgi:hypothetical protein
MVANIENLRPSEYKLTLEEQKKGGIRSGEVRKNKATFKNAIKWLINSDIKITKGDIASAFQNSGIDISKLDPTQLATIGLWYGAVQGNATNYKTLMEANEEIETNSETPTVEIKVVDNSSLEKVMYEDK